MLSPHCAYPLQCEESLEKPSKYNRPAAAHCAPFYLAIPRLLHDGRIELDTNPAERAIRPVALGRKNHLFAGSDDGGNRWAVLCSLIETCKLNDVEPYAWLRDVLTQMVDGHPVNRLDELLPWNWISRDRAAA